MLLSEHAIVHFKRGCAYPDRLSRKSHGHYSSYAQKMLDLYGQGIGMSRRELHQEVERIFWDEPDCDQRRIKSFCKLLDDVSTFDADRGKEAARLRMKVFSLAAAYHPLVEKKEAPFEYEEDEVKEIIADEVGLSWEEIDAGLYADMMEYHRLLEFKGFPEANAMLSRYNVAQAQACLYGAVLMTVDATRDFKTILRYAKLSRLLHDIQRLGPSRYRIVFSGPASMLRETRVYGAAMAKFLPALLACQGWRMTAVIQTPFGSKARLTLSPKDGLRSHLPGPEEFDSTLEEKFAKKFGEKREGWTLTREGEIVHDGQKAFVPDFVFRHDNGAEVLFEIAGFWTPEYLEKRIDTLRLFKNRNIIVAAPEESAKRLKAASKHLIHYKTSIKIRPVLEVLEEVRRET